MSLRYVFVPAPAAFSSQKLPGPCSRGECVPLGHDALARCASWEQLASGFPDGFTPDFLALELPYAAVPPWLLAAPIPVIGLAGDGSLLWHGLRDIAPHLDLVLADLPTVERLRRVGVAHARQAILYGVEQPFVEQLAPKEDNRPIDVLFVGNLNWAVQRERLPWLQRLARLGRRWRVVIATGVWGDAYRDLLRHSRIVFNRSARSELNRRVGESIGSGCLLLQERSNSEVPSFLEDGRECALYSDDDFEDVLERYLSDEDLRKAVAQAAHARAKEFTYEAFWDRALATIEREWDLITERSRQRQEAKPELSLVGRVWRSLSAQVPGTDPGLYGELLAARSRDPRDADIHNALGLMVALMSHQRRVTGDTARQAAAHFRDACKADSRHLMASVNFLEVLVALGNNKVAVEAAHKVLQTLDGAIARDTLVDAPHFPPGYDVFNVEWEKAAWDHAGDPRGEAEAKKTLLRWRLHWLLAGARPNAHHPYEAALARPDLYLSQAALGCALAQAGDLPLAVAHLKRAVAANPFDPSACRALCQALTDLGRHEEVQQLALDRRLLHQATGDLIAPEPWFIGEPGTVGAAGPKVQAISPEDFSRRFGSPDTSQALCGFTPRHDTHAVLTLLAHLKSKRIVEVGTADGQMTANLTHWSPDDATVFTLGITAEMKDAARPEQGYEAPPPELLGKKAGHFDKRHKVCQVTADSLHFDFGRLGSIDFAFIDGAHDRQHVASDSKKLYAALARGGCLVWHDYNSTTPWVEVNQGIEDAALPDPVFHIQGTQVAYLFKGHHPSANGQIGRARLLPSPNPQGLRVVWQGGFAEEHSLALVNREVCARLTGQGHELRLEPRVFAPDLGVPQHPLPAALARRIGAPLAGPPQVTVRHSWPPDLNPPREGHWVVIQPWEFGSLPAPWLVPFRDQVDEVWVPTTYVRDGFVASGLPEDRVRVVPNGVDVSVFRPEAPPLPLQTKKRFKFLFVGGTIWRKGIDVLLAAYGRAFTMNDDVCLVLKDMGASSFYQGQTAEKTVEGFRNVPFAPEVEYIDRSLSPEEVAGLYTACDCLVHPYRGEGFGLPIAEAMACARPVVVTNHGAALDFCDESRAYLIPAQVVHFRENHVGDVETVGRPWLAEPDLGGLVQLLRHVFHHPNEAKAKGASACTFVRQHLTWDHAAAVAGERLREVVRRPIRRAGAPPVAATPVVATPTPKAAATQRATKTLCMIVRNEEKNLRECLESVLSVMDNAVITDTGSTDRTREIALSFGPKVKVVDFPWVDSFSAARNESLRHATGDWIFWMDADDRLDPENRDKLKRLLDSLGQENVAYSMKCFCLPDPQTRTPTVVDHVRLFRNLPGMQWEFRVHEQILPAVRRSGGEVCQADVVITHTGYVDPALRHRKALRDLRLLLLEQQDQPDHPFTLFNLGSIYQELGRHREALDCLTRSLKRCGPGDSILRKVYGLIAGAHKVLGDRHKALAACREGLAAVPGDAELLFRAGVLLKEMGNYREAEASLWELLCGPRQACFASVDPALRGWRGRWELAEVLRLQGRAQDAKAQWAEVLKENPSFVSAWIKFGEAALAEGDMAALEDVARRLEQVPGGQMEAGVLRGRGLLAQKQVQAARDLARYLSGQFPQATHPRILLAETYQVEGTDAAAEEQALREVLLVNPCHATTQARLSDLLRRRMRTDNAVFEAKGSILNWVLGQRYEVACAGPSDLNEHLPELCDLARECQHVTDAGTGEGLAALAFLWAQPKELVCLDVVPYLDFPQLEALAGQTKVVFRRDDTLVCDLEATDLLFLDTKHDAGQLRQELARHAGKVRKYLVLHGTTQFAAEGQTPGQAGIWPVVEEFLARGEFGLHKRLENNGGLTVLRRVPPLGGDTEKGAST